jgi:hypothetical protein
LFCTAAFSQIYKWVDEEGVVHYTDSPPEDAESELVQVDSDAPKDAGDAQARLLERVQESARHRAEARQAKSVAEQAAAQDRLARQQRCVYARKQLISLRQTLPVYRDEEGTFRNSSVRNISVYDAYEGEREYLDDATRAREIDRVLRDILTKCENPLDATEQFRAGWEQMESRRCETALAKLKEVQQPEERSPRQDIEDAREEVEQYCEREN